MNSEALRIRLGLAPGERVVWHGRPDRTQVLQGLSGCGAVVGVGLSLVSGVIAGLVEPAAGASDLVVVTVLMSPIALGLAWFAALSSVRALRAFRTEYVLTTRRAIVRSKHWSTVDVEEYDLRTLAKREVIRRRRGRGDIVLAWEAKWDGEMQRSIARGFLGVARVGQVDDLVTTVLDEACTTYRVPPPGSNASKQNLGGGPDPARDEPDPGDEPDPR